jgi:hypothetical protein
MKTKLTLTVQKRAIDNAKRYSRKTGKSISQMFEEIFEQSEPSIIKTETQMAAERLLRRLKGSNAVKSFDDKALIRKHVAAKYS